MALVKGILKPQEFERERERWDSTAQVLKYYFFSVYIMCVYKLRLHAAICHLLKAPARADINDPRDLRGKEEGQNL